MAMVFFLLFTAGIIVSKGNANIDRNLQKMEYRTRRNSTEYQQGSKGCLEGWYPYGKSCFKTYGDRKEKMLTWEKAAEKCRSHRGHLVSIHSKEMQEFLIINLLLRVRTNVWIGLQDSRKESFFEWDDKSPLNFTNWARMEPSGKRTGMEDCVEMIFTSKIDQIGTWNNNSCRASKAFICQKDQEVTTEPVVDPRRCPDNESYEFHKTCYQFFDKKLTWQKAELFCIENYEGHLVSIVDFTVQLFLDYAFKNEKSQMWIGIRRKAKNVLRWESGWHLTFTNWDHKMDGDNFQNGFCAIRLINGRWDVASCLGTFSFVCEKSTDKPPELDFADKEATCPLKPDDWKDLGGDYCYYFDPGASVSWYMAQFLCMKRGGDLASIHSQAETDTIEQFVRFTKSTVFIGLFRTLVNNGEEENFQWADRSHFDFEFWDFQEPNDANEQCVEAITETMAWNDIICSAQRGYICSTRKVLPNGTTRQNVKACEGGFSSLTIVGVVGCVLFVVILVAVVLYYTRPWEKNLEESARKSSTVLQRPPTVHTETPHYRHGDMVEKEDSEYANTVM